MHLLGQGKPACARKPRSVASSKPQESTIDGLTQGLEVKLSLLVSKDVQQPEQFSVDAARRGDDRREEGVTHPFGRVARPILVNLLLYPLGELRLMSE